MNLLLKIACTCLVSALLFSVNACSKKADVKSSVSELEQAFPTPTAAAPAQPDPAAPVDANALVNQAVAAARANDYAGGVNALQAATRKPGVTADQVMSIQNAKRALVQELQNRAANGDQAAIAQLRAIERTRSQ